MIFNEEVLPALIKGMLQNTVSDSVMCGRDLTVNASMPLFHRHVQHVERLSEPPIAA
jgi:hypothetical protein